MTRIEVFRFKKVAREATFQSDFFGF